MVNVVWEKVSYELNLTHNLRTLCIVVIILQESSTSTKFRSFWFNFRTWFFFRKPNRSSIKTYDMINFLRLNKPWRWSPLDLKSTSFFAKSTICWQNKQQEGSENWKTNKVQSYHFIAAGGVRRLPSLLSALYKQQRSLWDLILA